MSIETSIIVPAYNEEKRMTPFIKELITFSSKNLKDYELIFIDDGSKDNTSAVFKKLSKNSPNIHIISYQPNKGKGEAVTKGVFSAKGKKIIFIDIDGSIRPKEIPEMIKKLDKYDVVVGSRAKKSSKVKQPPIRRLTSSLFNPYVNLLFNNNIKDHLCGFKGFKRDVARYLFKNLIDKRWLFDVELFYKIRKKKYKLYEQPIEWVHKGESKMKITEPFRMAFKLIVLRTKINKSIK